MLKKLYNSKVLSYIFIFMLFILIFDGFFLSLAHGEISNKDAFNKIRTPDLAFRKIGL